MLFFLMKMLQIFFIGPVYFWFAKLRPLHQVIVSELLETFQWVNKMVIRGGGREEGQSKHCSIPFSNDDGKFHFINIRCGSFIFLSCYWKLTKLELNICCRDHPFEQLTKHSAGGMAKRSQGSLIFSKNVTLLKSSECAKGDGKFLMPITMDMAKLKKPDTGQYKRNVEFSISMSDLMVRQKLQETFSSFDLSGRWDGNFPAIIYRNHTLSLYHNLGPKWFCSVTHWLCWSCSETKRIHV